MLPPRLRTLIFAFGVCVGLGVAAPLWDSDTDLVASVSHLLLHAFFPSHRHVRDMTCVECKALTATLDTMMANGATQLELEDFAITNCITYDLFPPDVCEGMVRLAGGEVLYVINNTDYNYDTICGWLLSGHCHTTELKPWTFTVPGGKPQPYHPDPTQPTAGTLRVLHLSDLHVDLLYDEGSAAVCQHPLCCRHAFGDPGPGELAAGHWGALSNCDIPLITLEDLVAQAALTSPDLVYVAGDLPPHDVWAQDHDSNLASINATMQVLKRYFPDTPVINALGNHASAPVNSFVTPLSYDSGYDMAWLYDALPELYGHWLPADTHDDLRRGGFFSTSPIPGLRVVSINMNYCNSLNWWLLLDNEDPLDELQWLVDTLGAAEAAGEVVHIVGHIPPGSDDCDHIWSHVFNQIITRYESTVRGLFYGHRHKDTWQMMYDPDTNYTRPVATVFIPGSGTTGDDHNPAFRVYTFDAGHDNATWAMLDTETYNMNLTLANLEGGFPEYTLRYRAQEAYRVVSMVPARVEQLIIDMATDDDLFREYLRNYHNYMDEPPEMWSCNTADCRKSELCKLATGDSSNRVPCERMKALVPDDPTTTAPPALTTTPPAPTTP